MSDFAFGSPEHLAGLSRAALEADFRFVNDRRNELEDACERLEAENRRLRSCLEDAAENDRLTTHEFNQLKEERDKLRELVMRAEKLMQGVLDNAGDTVVVSDLPCCDTLFDNLSIYREDIRELGIEVEQ